MAENGRGDAKKKKKGMEKETAKRIKDKKAKQRQAWARQEKTSKIRESNKNREDQEVKQ